MVTVRETNKNGRPTNKTAAHESNQTRYQSTGCKDCGAVAHAGTLSDAASQIADRIVPLRWLGYAGPHGGGK